MDYRGNMFKCREYNIKFVFTGVVKFTEFRFRRSSLRSSSMFPYLANMLTSRFGEPVSQKAIKYYFDFYFTLRRRIGTQIN